ncbi:MAG TPA: hypothetical protein VKA91_07340 [Nitrososphaeraceae archaeon]|nr:hypothetical protein [Nitrososphaeraceae archaeon]
MSEYQIDWEKIIHKVIHSKDNQYVGNVISTAEYRVTIGSHDANSEYSIPKSAVEGFNGPGRL